jgi:hypothetical protein
MSESFSLIHVGEVLEPVGSMMTIYTLFLNVYCQTVSIFRLIMNK